MHRGMARPHSSPRRLRSPATATLSALGLLVIILAGFVNLAPPAAAQGDDSDDEPTEAISGTFINRDDNNKPVAGVRVEVRDASGKKVGTAKSDEDGKYSLELPGPGEYTAELKVDSLPSGVRLTDASKTKLSFRVLPEQHKPLIFPFGKDTRRVISTWDRLPATLLDGVRLGLIIAMCSIGLSLIYGTTLFANFAHGEMVMFGALVTWFLNQEAGWDVIPAAVVATILSGIFGAMQELGVWGPLRRRKAGAFGMMTVSFGLSLFLVNLYQYFYGARSKPYSQYAIQKPLFTLGNSNVLPRVIVTIILSVVVLGGVALFLQKARFGKAMRAVADNGPLASASGINTDRVILMVWILGSALAGLGGVLNSLDQQVQFQQGSNLLLLMFAGITLGGLGTSFGAAAGCFLLGIAIQLSTLWVTPSLKNVGALIILVVVLLFRPQGVFGRRERVG